MRRLADENETRTDEVEPDVKDIELEGGCILCSGDAHLRITSSGAYMYCGDCHWISHPQMKREGSQVHVVHAAGGLA